GSFSTIRHLVGRDRGLDRVDLELGRVDLGVLVIIQDHRRGDPGQDDENSHDNQDFHQGEACPGSSTTRTDYHRKPPKKEFIVFLIADDPLKMRESFIRTHFTSVYENANGPRCLA